MISISPSSIEAAECPFYYKSEYLSGERNYGEGPDTALNLLFGRMAHMIAEKYTRVLMSKKLSSDTAIFDQVFDACWKTNTYLPESKYDELREVMVPWAEQFVINPAKVWGAEVELCFDWQKNPVPWDSPDKWLRSKLDRVDIFPEMSLAVIEDYKTGFYIPPQRKLRESLQTIIYPYTLWLKNPYLEHFRMSFYYVRWLKKITVDFHVAGTELLEMDSILFEPEKIEKRLRGFTERMTAKVEDLDIEWPAIRCSRCGICRYECPLIEKGIEPLRSEAQAVDVAMQIEAMEAKLKELKETLKGFTQSTETQIPVHNGEWGWRPSVTIRGLKADKVAEYALNRGISLVDVLSVNTKKIKEKADEEVRKDILAMGKPSVSSKFSFRKMDQTPDEGEEE